MELEGAAFELRAYIGDNDTYEDRPLHEALMDAARSAGCAGATALTGISGFGPTSLADTEDDRRFSGGCPVVVTVVDVEHRITALAEVFAAMVGEGLVTRHRVEVIVYRARGTTVAQ